MISSPPDSYLYAILVTSNFKLPEWTHVLYLKCTLKPPSLTSLKPVFMSLTSLNSVLFVIILEKYVKFFLSLHLLTYLTLLPVTPFPSPLSIMERNLHSHSLSFNLYSRPSLVPPLTILLKLKRSISNDFKTPLTLSPLEFLYSLPINSMVVPLRMRSSLLLHPPFLASQNVHLCFFSLPLLLVFIS